MANSSLTVRQMESQITTRQRRTHYQALAHKKYRRMQFMSGDGDWVVLSKCPREGTESWCYWLAPSQPEAEALRIEHNALGCGIQCQGQHQHRLWKIT